MPDDRNTWAVFRHNIEQDTWFLVGCTTAATAGDAFRFLVMKPGRVFDCNNIAEFRVFSLKDSARLAIELQLRDLNEPKGANA